MSKPSAYQMREADRWADRFDHGLSDVFMNRAPALLAKELREIGEAGYPRYTKMADAVAAVMDARLDLFKALGEEDTPA